MQGTIGDTSERSADIVSEQSTSIWTYPYLFWAALMPFGVDVVYLFTYQKAPIFGIPPAGIYTILLVPIFLLSIARSRVDKMRVDISFLFFALVLLDLLVLPLVGLRTELGYYSVVYGALLAISLFRPPTRANVELGTEALMATVFLLVVVSLVILPFLPPSVDPINPIRNPWASFLFPNPIGRVSGLFRGPGVFGLVCCLLICFGCLRGGRRALVYCIPASVGLLLSDSRSAFLALGLTAFASLVVILLRARRAWWHAQSAKGFVFALAFSAAYFAILGQGFFSGESHRLYIWQQALDHRDLSGEDFSHPHNFVLAALDSPSPVISVLLVLAAILAIVSTGLALKRGNLMAVILLLPTLIYSSFEFGIHWERLNIPSMVVLLGLLALRFGGSWQHETTGRFSPHPSAA